MPQHFISIVNKSLLDQSKMKLRWKNWRRRGRVSKGSNEHSRRMQLQLYRNMNSSGPTEGCETSISLPFLLVLSVIAILEWCRNIIYLTSFLYGYSGWYTTTLRATEIFILNNHTFFMGSKVAKIGLYFETVFHYATGSKYRLVEPTVLPYPE